MSSVESVRINLVPAANGVHAAVYRLEHVGGGKRSHLVGSWFLQSVDRESSPSAILSALAARLEAPTG